MYHIKNHYFHIIHKYLFMKFIPHYYAVIDMAYEPDKDPNYLEWKDAREATSRFDSILIDLRKYGFTLITGLTTAGSFLGFSSPDFTLLQGVIMVTMGLIVILYWLDIYYQNLLYGAVVRTIFLELFKLNNNSGRRGLASFTSSLHSGSGIRYFLHGIYYGFLVGLLILGIFLSTAITHNNDEKNSSINLKLQDGASITFEGGHIGPVNNSVLANEDNTTTTEDPFTLVFSGVKFPMILVITFTISALGMIYILVTADRRREKRWKCIRSYFRKKRKEANPDAELIENTVYYVFADKKGYSNGEKNTYNSELSDCSCN